MATRKELANAIRFLSMDAVKKRSQVTHKRTNGHGGHCRSIMA